MDNGAWIDTYRGTVFPWETDIVEHLTVAYYFERFADATLNLLESLGLGADYMRVERRGCVTVDCYVRYMHELRVGDILHISSAVIGVDADGLRLGAPRVQLRHGSPLRDGGAADRSRGAGDARGRAAAGRPAPCRRGSRQAAWDGPAREARWQPPPGSDGFLDSARDTVKPWEIDVFGQSAFPFYIHRFSAGGIQAFAQFGMTPAYMREQRRGMSTFEFQLEFLGELHAGDPVHVKTALLHLGNSSIRVLHRMFNGRTGGLVASLDQFGVHLDVDARRPTAFPDALRERARAILIRPKE